MVTSEPKASRMLFERGPKVVPTILTVMLPRSAKTSGKHEATATAMTKEETSATPRIGKSKSHRNRTSTTVIVANISTPIKPIREIALVQRMIFDSFVAKELIFITFDNLPNSKQPYTKSVI